MKDLRSNGCNQTGRGLRCGAPVARWAGINDKGDPLLWIESIPYWETRYYVPAVLRNMWVYQGLNDEGTPTLKSMAEHRWPTFPTGMTRLNH